MDFQRPTVTVVLPKGRNPWPGTVGDNLLIQYLREGGIEAADEFLRLFKADQIEEGRDSLGITLLDPTRRRGAVTLDDRIMAFVGIGPNWEKYIANAAAKADAQDRHAEVGIETNGELIDNLHLLRDAESGWGDSVLYRGAPGGGSGLSVEQDYALTLIVVCHYVDRVHEFRREWLAGNRTRGRNFRWLSVDDRPADEYAAARELALSPDRLVVVD